MPIRQAESSSDSKSIRLDLSGLSHSELRQGLDGWHAVLWLRGAEHRLWLKQQPLTGMTYAVELQLDDSFDARAYAARRLWRALNGRAPGPPFHALSAQRRQRLTLALRALDVRLDGGTYRLVAEVVFGAKRIPERAWKTHDLRNRTIRLIQTGLGLMRGGYRDLLRSVRRKP